VFDDGALRTDVDNSATMTTTTGSVASKEVARVVHYGKETKAPSMKHPADRRLMVSETDKK